MLLLLLALGVADAVPASAVRCRVPYANFGWSERITVVSAAYLREMEAYRARVELRDPEPTGPHGAVRVQVRRSEAARNTGDAFAIVFEDGGTLTRHELPYRFPDAEGRRAWVNTFTAPLPAPPPLVVHFVDADATRRCTAYLSANGWVLPMRRARPEKYEAP